MRLFERLRTAWNTLRDANQAQLLLTGPLPLWMQETFEREARLQGVDIGVYLFVVLREEAKAIRKDRGWRSAEGM